ncbi:hypothetical protein [Lelliottia amnigena]|jgi:hypothetical protein|uniref:hypothetical protein n=1 Tax=Lelliottia amnigena TaxID=61646 RepID=UPI00195C3D3E|nr:hypothetical protein [Lelliottia amnigena]MBM7357304.1 hypothetical protein [Lelliottia amnigena]WSO19535.1 hypothetical protein VUJ45_21220 [Lelliottia amnigena]
MKWIVMAFMFLAAPVLAEDDSYGPPIAVCLNKYTIPYINTDRPAIEVVDEAYDKCRDVLAQWDKERKSLPPELVVSQDKEFHAFYVHMIEARRKSDANKQ